MVYPDYYSSFKCIADKCKHSCCIGWEIDIDADSLEYYSSVSGDFGQKLRDNISLEGTPHFELKKEDRCPFLNNDNLCEIYTRLGKDKLCQICSDHPRFYNELKTHTEAGFGLCCEEAARLIITKKEPVKLLNLPDDKDNGIIILRQIILDMLQNRNEELIERAIKAVKYIESYVSNADASYVFNYPTKSYIPLFEKLERLDKSWSHYLELVKNHLSQEPTPDFESHIAVKGREQEYEQFICYLVYRHMTKAEFYEDALLYLCFAVLSLRLIYTMGSSIFSDTGDFTTENQLEIMRLFSSEIEYSDENIDEILNFLETKILST